MWLFFSFSFFPTAVFQSDRWPGQAVWTVLSRNDLLLRQTLFYILFPNKDPQMDVLWWCSRQGGRNIQVLLDVFGEWNKKLWTLTCLQCFIFIILMSVCLSIEFMRVSVLSSPTDQVPWGQDQFIFYYFLGITSPAFRTILNL